jgi:hypothetical protein
MYQNNDTTSRASYPESTYKNTNSLH